MDSIHCCEKRTTGNLGRPIGIGNGNRNTKRYTEGGIYDADKQDTHPRRGKTSGYSCFLQVNASSVPKSDWVGERSVLSRVNPELAL
jgi:hypothetical protein